MGSPLARHTGHSLRAKGRLPLREADIESRFANAHGAFARIRNRRLLRCLEAPIQDGERAVLAQMKTQPEMTWLQSVAGSGNLLALTMVVETGTIARLAPGGDVAASCRGVQSQRFRTGKVKGRGHGKNGHPYRSGAFVDAANVAIRFDAQSKRFSQRRRPKRPQRVTLKTVANQVARASYDMRRDQVPLDRSNAFS
jgi:transposase